MTVKVVTQLHHDHYKMLNAIRPILVGKNRAVIGTVLADCVSIWLMGIQGEEAEAARAEQLEHFVEAVEEFLHANTADEAGGIDIFGRHAE